MGDLNFPPFSQAINTLKSLCKEKRTGTLFLLTDAGHGSTVSIYRGDIINVFHLMKGGWEAVELLKEVKQASCFFNDGPSFTHDARTEYAPLPDNETIFEELTSTDGAVAAEQAVPTGPKKILVVDDSKSARKIVTDYLSGKDYIIHEAVDGMDAVEKVNSIKPDLILLDLLLPKLDGYGVLHVIRQKEEFKSIPVIAITSLDTPFDKLKGKSHTDEYLTKPVSEEQLLDKVKQYIGY